MISWFGIPGKFGIPEKRPHSCRTHVVRNGKCLCGTRQHPDAREQICSSESAYSAKLVECKKCARILSTNEQVRHHSTTLGEPMDSDKNVNRAGELSLAPDGSPFFRIPQVGDIYRWHTGHDVIVTAVEGAMSYVKWCDFRGARMSIATGLLAGVKPVRATPPVRSAKRTLHQRCSQEDRR